MVPVDVQLWPSIRGGQGFRQCLSSSFQVSSEMFGSLVGLDPPQSLGRMACVMSPSPAVGVY